jgi:hypothetical protein
MPELSVTQWHKKMWTAVVEAQHDEIKEKYGEDAADCANYGWGDASDGGRIDIATKVYLDAGHQVLSSTADYPSEEIEHNWNEY